MRTAILDGMIQFLSTPSARRATAKRMKAKIRHWISIHALREEGDSHDPTMKARFSQFLSTPSARRATCRCAGKRTAIGYFYPRPPRGGRHGSPMGWDRFGDFYPRPPRGGRRVARMMSPAVIRFLSTPSARRATERWVRQLCGEGFLSTPSARRATVSFPASCRDRKNFYPRPPRGGRPGKKQAELTSVLDFYPRPPRGGRQQKQRQNLYFLINYTTFCTNLEEL